MNNLIKIGGIPDQNDLAFIVDRFGEPLMAQPAPVVKGNINPQCSRFFYKDWKYSKFTHTVDIFHVKPVYYQHRNGQWRPMSEVCLYHGNQRIDLNEKWQDIDPNFFAWLVRRTELIGGVVSVALILPKQKDYQLVPIREGKEIFFTTDTFYPDPGHAGTTCDGLAYHNAGASWSATRDATSCAYASADEVNNYSAMTQRDSSTQHTFCRAFYHFSTSSIADDDTISSAVLSIYQGGNDTNDTDSSYNYAAVVQSFSASNNNIVAADYDQCGALNSATELSGRINCYTGAPASSYQDWTLNASGLAIISKTGITKLGLRTGRDILNTDFPSNNLWVRLTSNYADQTGTANDPKLVVVHSGAGQIISVSDAFGLTESLSALRSLKTSQSDTLSFSESVSALKVLLISVSDSIGLTEAINTIRGFKASVSDTLNFSESISSIRQLLVSVSDSISFTEAVTSAKTFIINVSDTLHFTEASAILRSWIVSVSDTFRLTESLNIIFKTFFKPAPIRVDVELKSANATIELKTAKIQIDLKSGSQAINL